MFLYHAGPTGERPTQRLLVGVCIQRSVGYFIVRHVAATRLTDLTIPFFKRVHNAHTHRIEHTHTNKHTIHYIGGGDGNIADDDDVRSRRGSVRCVAEPVAHFIEYVM